MKQFFPIFILFISFEVCKADFKEEALIEAQKYEAQIIRDIWGVPHIQGKRDEDVAFGLAFAHAEDDMQNLIKNMSLYRAQMGLNEGFDGAVTDYLIKVLGIRERVTSRYESDLSVEVRKVIES